MSAEVAALDGAYVLSTYARQPLEIVAGEGSELIGRDGTPIPGLRDWVCR